MLFAQFKKTSENNNRDQNLWSALRLGQREALSELFQRYHKQLYNYGIKIIANEDRVNEAIQELFLNLWDRYENLSSAHSVKAYLLSSLRRLIIKQINRDKNRAERNRNYIEEQGELAFSIENLLIRKEVDREKSLQLQESIKTLTERQREAIFLKFYHGLTNKELAAVMGINYQCVRNLLYNALKRLRLGMKTVSIRD